MFTKFWALVEAFGVAKGENGRLLAENARLHASCDYLSTQVTKLEAERAVLLERLLGLQIPQFQTVVEPAAPAPEPRLSPEALARLEMKVVPMPEGSRGRIFTPPADPGAAAGDDILDVFGDMGDDRARALGVTHTPDGTVVHAR